MEFSLMMNFEYKVILGQDNLFSVDNSDPNKIDCDETRKMDIAEEETDSSKKLQFC